MKQKVIKIFQKFFQMMKQDGHGYPINKNFFLKIWSLRPFSRGWSQICDFLLFLAAILDLTPTLLLVGNHK